MKILKIRAEINETKKKRKNRKKSRKQKSYYLNRLIKSTNLWQDIQRKKGKNEQ